MSSANDTFVVTLEYRRFTEFADAVREHRYIGLCYGPPGVGKTLSARRYAHWDSIEPYLRRLMRARDSWAPVPPILNRTRTVMWTPAAHVTPRQLQYEIDSWCHHFVRAVRASGRAWEAIKADVAPRTELLVVDEADRLKQASLEQLRDFYDRSSLGLILIGMPGMERRLARYPQLYSRVGFAHEYRPLAAEELTFVLTNHWQDLGLRVACGEFNDPEIVAAVARITGGNLRLVQRLFTQISRILEVNELSSVTREAVETARESLIIGPP
jgi:DNA transposition AAA+ family ATPase